MKTRTRLTIAFLIVTVIPILFIFLAFYGFRAHQERLFQRSYELTDQVDFMTANSVQVFNRLTSNAQEEIREAVKENADQFDDIDFLETINEQLQERYAYLIVRRDNEIIYDGADGNDAALYERLPMHGDIDDDLEGGLYIDVEDDQYLVKQVDFVFSDGSEGSVFIVSLVLDVIPEIRSMLRQFIIASLVIMLMIGILLISWIYQSLLSPLRQLSKAMHEIKNGNLDYSLDVDVDSDDEIGSLCKDFEEMRIRLKESAEEKEQYAEENRELLSNISHDLKTPITSIKGYVEGILDGVASSPEKMDKYIRTIQNKANEMDRLVDELSFYTKIDTNKIPYTFSKINVAEYFNDCVEELEVELEAENIQLGYFNYVDENVMIIADAEQLRRVINNIVSNSVKYIDKEKGIINIRITDAGDFVEIIIEDNGMGISAKDLPYIFDRFYRTDVSRGSAKGGSGIGLSIVHKIIEDHGGRIWATSKEGIGTEMHIALRKYQEVILDEENTDN